MPVRFLCPACHQLLSIGTRKIGSEVDCPKCRSTILVPDPQQPARRDVANPFEHGGMEQALASIASGTKPASERPPLSPKNSPAATELLQPGASQPPAADDSLIVISRRTLYLQAALLAVVAIIAFYCGYLIGNAGR
jgi:DNA-directed RNA polymerase subunit RPC12/RpoP